MQQQHRKPSATDVPVQEDLMEFPVRPLDRPPAPSIVDHSRSDPQQRKASHGSMSTMSGLIPMKDIVHEIQDVEKQKQNTQEIVEEEEEEAYPIRPKESINRNNLNSADYLRTVSDAQPPAPQKINIPFSVWGATGVSACLGAWTRYQLSLMLTAASTGTLDIWHKSYFLPNVLGCIVLGCFTHMDKMHKMSSIILTTVSVGFCGSLTTFSSWMQDVSLNLARGNVDTALFLIAASLSIYVSAYNLGKHSFELFDALFIRLPNWIAGAFWLTCCFVPAIAAMCKFWTPIYVDFLVLASAPLGSWTRFYLSLKLNPKAEKMFVAAKENWFPVGTFAVNVLGTLIVATLENYNGTTEINGTKPSAWVTAVNTFFAGALSTVSSFVKEACMDVSIKVEGEIIRNRETRKSSVSQFRRSTIVAKGSSIESAMSNSNLRKVSMIRNGDADTSDIRELYLLAVFRKYIYSIVTFSLSVLVGLLINGSRIWKT